MSTRKKLAPARAALAPIDANQRYTIDEASAYLRISRVKLYRKIAHEKFPSLKDGRRRYVPGVAIIAASTADQATLARYAATRAT